MVLGENRHMKQKNRLHMCKLAIQTSLLIPWVHHSMATAMGQWYMVLWQEKVVHLQQHLPPCSTSLHKLRIYVWHSMDTAIITPLETSHHTCVKMSIRLLGCKGTCKRGKFSWTKGKNIQTPSHGLQTHTHAHPRQVSTHDHVDADRGLFFFIILQLPSCLVSLRGKKERKENIYKPPVKKEKHALTHTGMGMPHV